MEKSKRKAPKVIQAPEDPQGSMGQRDLLVPRESKGSEENLALKGTRGARGTWVPVVQKVKQAMLDLWAPAAYLALLAPLASQVPREKLDPWGPRVSQEPEEYEAGKGIEEKKGKLVRLLPCQKVLSQWGSRC
jgi:hypothetical protein